MAENGNSTDGGKAGSTQFSFDDNSGASSGDGNGTAKSAGVVDPATLKPNDGTGSGSGGAAGTGTKEKRGRGRPRLDGKPSGSKTATPTPLDLTFIELVLTSINAGVVALTHMPEMAVSAEENQRVAKAVQNLAQYYPVYVDPKTQAWLGLITVLGQVYGTRAVAVALTPKPKKKAEPTATNNGQPNGSTPAPIFHIAGQPNQ